MSRCDLHLHSSASRSNEEWYSRYYNCPESYVDPARQYELCKQRGMTLVTLTDHDTIDGGLQLIDRPDFFLSEEVTTRFPENGCVVHVLVWNITPLQHKEIQACRNHVYDLVAYLESNRVAHGLAHPLFGPNDRLDADTLEKALLLFGTLERTNGMTSAHLTSDFEAILAGVDIGVLERLTAKHGIAARHLGHGEKAFTAGSDDHTHRRSGTVFTEVGEPALSPAEFMGRCMAGRGKPVGRQADLRAMALAATGTAYRFLGEREKLRGGGHKDPFVDLIDALAGRAPRSPFASYAVAIAATRDPDLEAEAGSPEADPIAPSEPATDESDARVLRALTRMHDRVLASGIVNLLDSVAHFDLGRLFATLTELGGASAGIAPFVCAARHFGEQERQARRVRDGWTVSPIPQSAQPIALISDSLEQIDGISTFCRRFLGASRERGRKVLIPYCGPRSTHFEFSDALQSIPEVMSRPLPFYSAITLRVPSPVALTDWMWRRRIGHVELATCGPMGLGALMAARILCLPVSATYHVELDRLVSVLGGNGLLAQGLTHYLKWFYRQIDRIAVFSESGRAALLRLGVEDRQIALVPSGVDTEEFSPTYRAPDLWRSLDPRWGDRPVILSVGRLSEEKNIPIIVEAVARLQDRAAAPILAIVGEGPARAEWERTFGALPFVRFLGLKQGRGLSEIYASATMFVFASEIDTVGLVNMEAMASGIPVLVPRTAAFADLVSASRCAECYSPSVDGLSLAICRVLDDPSHARRLADAGRRAMVERWSELPFNTFWESQTASSP